MKLTFNMTSGTYYVWGIFKTYYVWGIFKMWPKRDVKVVWNGHVTSPYSLWRQKGFPWSNPGHISAEMFSRCCLNFGQHPHHLSQVFLTFQMVRPCKQLQFFFNSLLYFLFITCTFSFFYNSYLFFHIYFLEIIRTFVFIFIFFY